MINVKIEEGRPVNLYTSPECNCTGQYEVTTTRTVFEDGKPVKMHEVEYKNCKCTNCKCKGVK